MQGLLKTSRKVSFDPKILDSCQETGRKGSENCDLCLGSSIFFSIAKLNKQLVVRESFYNL